MKSVAILALLGLISTTQAVQRSTNLGVRFVQEQSTTMADLEQFLHAPCDPALPMTEEQMKIEMDYFSRKFDIKHYNNAMKIFAELKKNGFQGKGPHVTTWELYDKAFSFDRVRKYELVEQQMNIIEHFEDNLNTNISNSVLVQQFIAHAKEAQRRLKEKYNVGQFKDPATVDPQADD